MATPEAPSWLDSRHPAGPAPSLEDPIEFVRLWRGFMTARVTLGLVLVLLQAVLHSLGQSHDWLLTTVCGAYLLAALGARWLGRPRFGKIHLHRLGHGSATCAQQPQSAEQNRGNFLHAHQICPSFCSIWSEVWTALEFIS